VPCLPLLRRLAPAWRQIQSSTEQWHVQEYGEPHGRQLGVLFDETSDIQSKQIVRQVKAIHRRDMLGQKVWPREQHG